MWSQTLTAVKVEGSHYIGVYAIHTRYVGTDAFTKFKPKFLVLSTASKTNEPTPMRSVDKLVLSTNAGTGGGIGRNLALGIDGNLPRF